MLLVYLLLSFGKKILSHVWLFGGVLHVVILEVVDDGDIPFH